MVRDGYLKKFINEDKTRIEKTEARTNSQFNRGDNETERIMNEEEDLPLDTIHMIGGPYYPDLENRIRREIRMIK